MSIYHPSREQRSDRSSERSNSTVATNPSSLAVQNDKRGGSHAQRNELKLVYRALRLVSEWALSDFFSEVCVDGAENVTREGPLILIACHHNEIIDIATLSATVPHRRIIAYWAKASLFRSTIGRFILTSAGAIPVARTPRSPPTPNQEPTGAQNGVDCHSLMGNGSERGSNGQQALFDATYRELAKRDGVLGVFPEGTSYTLPRIVQVKEGAARATLGFIHYAYSNNFTELMNSGNTGKMRHPISVVPVGITYTDKSRYRSRLYVRYGKPIDMVPFMASFVSDNNAPFEPEYDTFQSAVRKLTEEIEKVMMELTINAPNWDTLYAVRTARALLWEDERSLQLHNFVDVSKRLVKLFDSPSKDLAKLKRYLLDYHALCHHTGLSHATITHVPFPPINRSNNSTVDNSNREVLKKSSIVRLTVSLARFIGPLLVSLPTHVAHVPAYVLATVASRAFASEEEEARAQYKVIFGGLGRVVGTLASGFAAVRFPVCKTFLRTTTQISMGISKSCFSSMGRSMPNVLPDMACFGWLGELANRCRSFAEITLRDVLQTDMAAGGLRDWVCIIGVAWFLSRWHAWVIDSNYARWKRARATLTVLRAVLPSRRLSPQVDTEEFRPYLSVPPPPLNPYIAKSMQSGFSEDASEDANVNSFPASSMDSPASGVERHKNKNKKARGELPKSVLVRYLLLTRADAVQELRSTFRSVLDQDLNDMEEKPASGIVADVRYLRECGAAI